MNIFVGLKMGIIPVDRNVSYFESFCFENLIKRYLLRTMFRFFNLKNAVYESTFFSF